MKKTFSISMVLSCFFYFSSFLRNNKETGAFAQNVISGPRGITIERSNQKTFAQLIKEGADTITKANDNSLIRLMAVTIQEQQKALDDRQAEINNIKLENEIYKAKIEFQILKLEADLEKITAANQAVSEK